MAGNNLLNWSWSTQHVQSEITNQEYLSAEATLILAGPPRLSQLPSGGNGNVSLTGSPGNTTANNASVNAPQVGIAAPIALDDVLQGSNVLFPVGLIGSLNLQQARALRSIFEIGSVRRYIIPEKIITQMNISRVKFYGPSLMRTLYAYYPNSKLNFNTGAFVTGLAADNNQNLVQLPQITGDDVPGYGNLNSEPVGAGFNTAGASGADSQKNNRDFWMNLQSSIFKQPFGLGLYLQSSNKFKYGALYLEEILLGSHNIGFSANDIIIMETVQAELDRMVPIQIMDAVGPIAA